MTPKKQIIYERAVTLFADKAKDKDAEIKHKIENSHDIELVEYTDEMIKMLLNDVVYDNNLFKRCIVPPFSVFDTKQGDWMKRRALLDEYFGSSVVGRKTGLAYGTATYAYKNKDSSTINGNTSQFDSLLCEVILKWFGFPDCTVFDSYAGGHIRGTMAALLGYKYIGIELAKDQVAANEKRFIELGLDKTKVKWINDDSLNMDNYIKDNTADLFFSCPPYGDLEKYTDDPRDLSNMTYQNFLIAYQEIIKKGLAKLKNNRFAVFVVGDFRDEKGFYRGFVKDTIQAFEDCGASLYNEIILLNQLGTAPMRAGQGWPYRKVVKLHQNVLIFFKGDPQTIKENYPEIDSTLPVAQAKQTGLF